MWVFCRWRLAWLLVLPLAVSCGGGQSAADYRAEGDAALARGEPRAALIAFRNALQADPTDGQVRVQVGRVQLELGDAAAAEHDLTRAQRLGANEGDVQPWLAKAWLRQGKLDLVLDLPVAEDWHDGLRAEVLAVQSEALLARGDREAAQERAGAALAIDEDSASAELTMARVLAATDDPIGARARVERVLALDSGRAAAWRLLGELERADGHLEAAEAAFTEAMRDPVEGAEAQLNRALVRIQARRFDEAQQDIEQLRRQLRNEPVVDYADGLLLFERGEYQAAIAPLDRALGANPNLAPALVLAGATRLTLGQPAAARVHLQRAVSVHPEDPDASRLLATALLQLGEFGQAEVVARAVLNRAPDDVAAMDLLANALVNQGKGDESLTYLRQVKAIVTDSAEVSARLGVALLGQGDTQAGLRALQEALDQDPVLQGAAEQLILAAIRAGDLDQALSAARTYQEGNPQSARASSLLGAVQLQRNESAEAAESFSRALELDPAELSATNGLMTLAVLSGDYRQAQNHVQAALTHHPDHPQLLIELARLALAQQDSAAAEQHLAKAVAANADELEPKLLLAALHLMSGAPAETLHVLATVRKDYPGNVTMLGLVADAQLALNHFGAAKATLAELDSLTPGNPRVLLGMARANAGLGDVTAAKAQAELALALDADLVPAINLLGRIALAERDLVGAERRVQELQERLGEDHADVVFAKGQLAQMRGDAPAAEDALQRLLPSTASGIDIDANPRLWNMAEQMLLSHLNSGDLDAARRAAATLIERQPGSASAHALKGLIHLRAREIDEATAAFSQSLELEAGNVLASTGLAAIAVEGGDYPKGKAYLETSLNAHPDDANLLVNLARLALNDEDPGTARGYLERAVDANPHLLTARLHLGALLLRENEPQAALGRLDPVRADYPDHTALLGLLAEAELGVGAYAEARTTLEHLTKLDPGNAEFFIALANARVRLGDVEGTENALLQALERDPNSLKALTGLARLSLSRREVAEAGSYIDRLDGILGGDDPNVLLLRGSLAEAEGDAASAFPIYEKLFERAPSTVTLLPLARAGLQLGQEDMVSTRMAEWLAIHPTDHLIRFELAQLYTRLGRSEEAVDHFEKVLDANPSNIIALNNLAWLLQESDPVRALDYARQAYLAAPNSAEVMDTLALVLLRNGDVREARRMINLALDAAPDNGTLMFHRAKILSQGGESALAARALERALEGDRQFPERAEAEAMLQSLRGG